MACVDSDEISHAVELVLHDVWKVVGALKAPQTSSSWLSEFQWKQFRQCCVQIMERTRRERLSIGLVAPMRSGKSTMLNALLGIALLPTDPRLSAKCPITVHYTPRRKGSKLKLVEHSGKISTGLEGVRQRLHELLESPSNDDWHMEPPLELNAALCKSLGSEADSIVKLDLTEIPSLSSVNPHVLRRDKIKTSLDDLDGAFFLIDATRLQTEGEAEMIKELKESFPEYMPQHGHRLYFCVTKADIPIDTEEVDHTELQNYVASLLQEAGFHTQPSQVFVVSPLTALLSRLVIADKNDADVQMQFGQLAWGTVAESITDKAIWKAKGAKLLELSGVPKFEDQVLGFLHRNCEALKLISLLDEANRTLQHILHAAHSFKTMLSRTLNDSRHSMDRLKSQLDNGLLQLEATKTELVQIEKDAPIKVQEILIKLKNVLLQRIGSALACEIREDRSSSELPCGWLSIRQDFLALINHIEPDQKHAEELVKELHEEVTGQIRSEMEIAWMVAEELIRDRHFELVLRTNQDLDYLSKVLEPIVIKDLNIQIEPAAIKLKQINNLSFQKDVGELLGAAIKQQTLERSYLSRYIWGAQYSAFMFDGAAIREFFENIVREITDDAIHQLQSSVRRHVSGQIASSEEKIRSFGETFAQGIQAAIESRVTTLDSNAISMQRVIEDIDTVKKLKNVITSLRRKIETGLSTGQPCETQTTTTTTTPPQPELYIQCQKRDEPEAKEADHGRYIPPRARVPSQEAITPKLTSHDRADSFAFSDLSESVLESPHSATVGRSNGAAADNWRLGRSASTGWTSWTGNATAAAATPTNNTTHRSTWSAASPPIPPRETPTSAHTPVGDNFSPRSNFFRSFQQTPRAARGRGHETPKSPHWSG